MEYDDAQDYLIDLYFYLLTEENSNIYGKIYEEILKLFTKGYPDMAIKIIRILNIYDDTIYDELTFDDVIIIDFISNKNHSLSLIANYLNNIMLKNILDNKKLKKSTYEVNGLNDFLRSTLMDVFEVILENDCYNGFDPFFDLEMYLNADMNYYDYRNDLPYDNVVDKKLSILRNYRPYLANIICSDLYEYMFLDEKHTNLKEVLKQIILNRNSFETDILLEREILKLYITLNANINNRKEARKKFNGDDFSLIRKINPLYKLDS